MNTTLELSEGHLEVNVSKSKKYTVLNRQLLMFMNIIF